MPALTNARREQFAQLVSVGVSATQAYIKCGYSKAGAKQGAARLLTFVDVATRVAELKPAADAKAEAKLREVIERDMQTRQGRAQALQDRRSWILAVIGARSVFPDHQDVPGGKTGLVVTTHKLVAGIGPVKEHAVDVALLRELRETEKQIAQELGQFSDKHQLVGDDGTSESLSINVNFVRPNAV